MQASPPNSRTPNRYEPARALRKETSWSGSVVGISLALVAATFLSGCTSAVTARKDAAGGERVDGGIVKVGSLVDYRPGSIYSGGTPPAATITGLVFETLTRYDKDDLSPQPVLATSWDVSEDGKTVALELRDGVRFSSGEELTSADVEASLKNYADPAHTGQLARNAQQITEYEIRDDKNLTLHLGERINNLFDLFDRVPIIQQDAIDEFNTGTAFEGTGAFTFDKWTPGTSIEFSRNEEYWRGPATIDGVELVVTPNEQTLTSQVRSGQLDLVDAINPRDAEAFSSNPLYNVVDKKGAENLVYLGFNVHAPGLDDKRIRQAIAYALDRQRILEEVYQGRGEESSLPWSEYSPAFDREKNDHFDRDLDKARALLAEAGPIPKQTLTYPSNSLHYQNVAQIIETNLREVGIDVALEPAEQTDVSTRLTQGKFSSMWLLEHSFGQFNPSTLVTSAFPFNSKKNASNFLDESYDSHVVQSWRNGDPTGPEARNAYEKLNNDLLDHVFLTDLVAPELPVLYGSNVHGVDWRKRGELDLSRAYFTR